MGLFDAPGTTLLRDSWQARILNAVLLCVVMLFLISRSEGGAVIALVALWVLLLLGELYRMWRPVALLTPSEIRVLNLRQRQIPWAQIREITTEKRLGTRRIVLVLDDASRVIMDGPSETLLAPRGTLDKAVATIRREWTTHRGSTWAPVPPDDSERALDGGTPPGA